MSLTRAQQAELGFRVKHEMANLVEFASEMLRGTILEGADLDDVRAQLAVWAARIPGDVDTRIE